MTDMDLVEFLTARLDEDEQSARAATGEAWNILTIGPEESPDDWVPIHLVVSGDDVAESRGDHGLAYAEHIARHDPARVLADVAAKRRIIDGLVRTLEAGDAADWDASEQAGWILAVLAAQYADHSDYRSEWAP